MPTWQSFEAFGREIDRLDRTIKRDNAIRVTKAMAEAAEPIATAEARRDLGGDTRFSGWRGRDLADLQIKRLRSLPGTGHMLAPTRKSGGPWKVADTGRNRSVSTFGGATGRGGVPLFQGPGINRQSGITSRTKTGKIRKVRRSKAKRWNGYTDGFGTATRAQREMDRRLPAVAERETLRSTRRHFDVS